MRTIRRSRAETRLYDAAMQAAEGDLSELDALAIGPLKRIREKARRFDEQSRLFDSMKVDQLCVERGDFNDGTGRLIPVDLTPPPPEMGAAQIRHGKYIEEWAWKEGAALHEDGLRVTPWPSSFMRSAFGERLYDFLSVRLSPIGKWLFKTPMSTYQGGLEVTVHTNLRRHKILCTESFFFNRRQGFGSCLSTPVTGELDPGFYIFGATSGTTTLWEDVEEKVPPRTIYTAKI